MVKWSKVVDTVLLRPFSSPSLLPIALWAMNERHELYLLKVISFLRQSWLDRLDRGRLILLADKHGGNSQSAVVDEN